jgi:hypothetical protein
MEEKPIPQSESNDRKEISIIIAVGVIIIACTCCLLAVAGIALYRDLPTDIFQKGTATVELHP